LYSWLLREKTGILQHEIPAMLIVYDLLVMEFTKLDWKVIFMYC